MEKLKTYSLMLIALLALCSAGYFWYQGKQAVTPSDNYAVTPEMKKAKKVDHKKIIVPVRIDVLDKEEAVKKLNINDPVKSDPNKQITTTAEIKPYDGKTSIVSVLDTSTGESEIIAQQEELSLFEFENKREIGARVGYSTDGLEMQSTVYGRWQFLRVGNFHLGAYAEANSSGEGIAQLEVSYKF